MPPNLFGHTTSGLHVRQAAVAGVESSQDPFHELWELPGSVCAVPYRRGASCKYGVRENHSDYCNDYKRQKAEFQISIATNVATTKSEAQKFWISWLVQNEKQKILLSGMRIGLHFWLFLLRKKSASIAV